MKEQLPTRRAFLLRLSSGARPAAGIHHGKIEHIRSGRTREISSMETIQNFITEVLADEESGANGGED
jgi:hypothetical protein